jgi:hypothetical protein
MLEINQTAAPAGHMEQQKLLMIVYVSQQKEISKSCYQCQIPRVVAAPRFVSPMAAMGVRLALHGLGSRIREL